MIRNTATAAALLGEVREEMVRQDRKWGWPRPDSFLEDDHGAPDEHGEPLDDILGAAELRARQLFQMGRPCWQAILAEEVGEGAGETDPEKRVAELVQVAAVALSHAQHIMEWMAEGGGE